jgi:hypothetical protein
MLSTLSPSFNTKFEVMPCVLRRRPREHRRKAHHRTRRIRRLHALVNRPASHHPLQIRLLGLTETIKPATVYDDDDYPLRQRLPDVHLPRRSVRVRRLPVEKEPVNQERGHPNRDRETQDSDDPPGAHGFGDEVLECEQHQHRLRDLLQKIPARRVGVLQHEAPEPDEVGLRRAGAQVIVERAPEEHGKEHVKPEREPERREVHEPEQQDERYEEHPQRPPQLERKVVADEDEDERGDSAATPATRASRRRRRRARRRVIAGTSRDEDRVEALALVQHVPEAGGHDLELRCRLHRSSSILKTR